MNWGGMDDVAVTPELLAGIRRSKAVCLDTETFGLAFDDRILGMGVAWYEERELRSMYLNVEHPPSLFYPRHTAEEVRAVIGAVFGGDGTVYMHNAVFDLEKLIRWGWISQPPHASRFVDTQTLARIAVPFDEGESTSLEHLCDRLVEGGFPEGARMQKKQRAILWKKPAEMVSLYGRADAESTLRLAVELLAQARINYADCEDCTLWNTLVGRESEFLLLLLKMQLRGILLDQSFIDTSESALTQRSDALLAKMAEMGFRGNPASRDDLIGYFGVGSLPKTEKGNPSVNEDALEQVGHPLGRLVLEWRSLRKAVSTWLRGFTDRVSEDGRIHPRFNAAGTISSRLSCTEPNVLAIPLDDRNEAFGSMAGIFRPDEGFRMWASDWEQAELRVVAMYAASVRMAEIFASGEDVHMEIARLMWPGQEITLWLRQLGKRATYTITYGGGARALAESVGIGYEEARKVIQLRRATFPAITLAQSDAERRWRERGYMVSISGRRRFLGESERERTYKAFNQVVQMSVAEMMKDAMLAADAALADLGGWLALQVYDSLEYQLPEGADQEGGRGIVEGAMVGACPAWLMERVEPEIRMEVATVEWGK